MKVVILAGGLGTRMSEETGLIPKPMVEIGGQPILWHIMKHYSHHGFHDFVVLLGHRGQRIKDYFASYALRASDVAIDLARNSVTMLSQPAEPWRVTLLDTGEAAMTGGRLKRAEKAIGAGTFLLTYGDGVSNIDLKALLAFHRGHGKAMTMTAIQPEGRFGAAVIDARGAVTSFNEKPRADGAWVNGGFFVCEDAVFGHIRDGDATVLERGPMEALASAGQLMAYRHDGFWRCMDTLRDKVQLQELWDSGKAQWKTW
jgi:glucose-1-phosphate cytidylyltransferase